MAIRQIPIDEFLAGQYERTFRQNDPNVHPDLWQPYNPNADYGAATGDYAGAGGPNQQKWMAQRVLGGQTPEAYFDAYNRKLGIDPTTFSNWTIGGARYDPATGMVLQSDSMGGDPFGGLAMGLAGGFLGGVGALGSLSGITGGADLGAGSGLYGGTGLGAGGAMDMGIGGIGESMGLGAGYTSPTVAGGLTGVPDTALGVNQAGTFNPGSYNPADPLGLGAGNAGGVSATNLTGTVPGDFTLSQLPGGSLNTGLVDLGGAGGVVGAGTVTGGLTLPNIPTLPTLPSNGSSNDIIEEINNFTNTPTPATPATPATGGTPLSRVIDALTNGQTPSMADILSLGGTLGSTLLGIYGSNQQADSLRDLANQARADRQPFLNKSLEWLNDPAAYAAGPGKASLDATLRALSVQGNPFGSPTSLALAGDIANRNWQNAVTGFGNIGLSGQDSRNQILSQAINADSGALNSLGYGLENIFNPKPQNTQLNNLMRQFGLV